MTIKALETKYKGYLFRSRLEARWALFFDTLGIEYWYEPEGFDIDGVWYLPDFWLPGIFAWLEIKGRAPTEQELEKLARLSKAPFANQRCFHAFLFSGDISPSLDYEIYGAVDGKVYDGAREIWFMGLRVIYEINKTDFRNAHIAARQARFGI